MATPKLSVIMSVHNGLPYVEEALASILSQTFTAYELIVVDDASTDGSAEFLAACRDERLRLVTNEHNLGLTKSLNKALDLAQGEYVARMDHDDVSLSSRLTAQVAFLDANPGIDVLGTWARTVGRRPEQTWRYPLADAEIRCELLFNSVLVHSSVMWRRQRFEELGLRYDPAVNRAQDYELWTRAANAVRFANLDQVLVEYRIHPQQVGQTQGEEQAAVAKQVRRRQLEALGLEPSDAELELHNRVSNWLLPDDEAGLRALDVWLLKLVAANEGKSIYPPGVFGRVLAKRWWAACRGAVGDGLDAWQLYRSSPLADLGQQSWAKKASFRLQSWWALRGTRD